ncbi:hypothetical protein Y1Q_0008337 [Alligator mississippiensis]|uniref:Uncharacterized protein n=1 Tax=Alligator mississippiensis TaxID=8496 RepID=A0A151N256_ALLMI|nr:hypothetical protein Y1Q_0008337 [Alligator mississippiensis]
MAGASERRESSTSAASPAGDGGRFWCCSSTCCKRWHKKPRLEAVSAKSGVPCDFFAESLEQKNLLKIKHWLPNGVFLIGCVLQKVKTTL